MAAPVAVNDSYTTNEDGDALTASVVSTPANGTVTLNTLDGSFTYTPDANFNGTDSFTYQVDDGTLASNVATVTLTVTPINDAPVAARPGPAWPSPSAPATSSPRSPCCPAASPSSPRSPSSAR